MTTQGNIHIEKYPEYQGLLLPGFPSLQTNCDKRMKEISNFESRDSDILMCTYPKSGTHWSNEIISILLSGNQELLKSMKIDTMLELLDNDDKLEGLPSPRLLNSHLPLRFLPKKHLQNKYKIIHVVRNPKDVIVAFYHHSLIDPCAVHAASWDAFFNDFISGNVPFGSWFSHVKDFEKEQKINPNILLLYYEELHKDPRKAIEKICDFIGIKRVSAEDADKIAAITSFENMKKNKVDFSKAVTEDGFIYRKGKIGDWKNYFTEEQNKIFDDLYNKNMKDSTYKFIYE